MTSGLRASHLFRIGVAFAGLTTLWPSAVFAQSTSAFPHLRSHGSAFQLYVHNRPFLMLGGELGNSSASDVKYMANLGPKLRALHLNTVLVPVYWEFLEPEEGRFDFTLVDNIITSARNSDLKVVLLWFGSWKNSMSCYVPSWVKTDQKRFPRSRTVEGSPLEILTAFSDENRISDARAFAVLMKHLRAIDGKRSTVIMVQVENEIGMIPLARDYCVQAQEAFSRQVPRELMTFLERNDVFPSDSVRGAWRSAGKRNSGTWEEVFGRGTATDEIFMAWHFAKYANSIAEAGKREYPLPMYVNAALIRPGDRPGHYPSAGPLPHLMGIWRSAAPQIDFFAPDIYFNNFAEWLGRYDQDGNATFVPEVDRRQSATNAFYAFARHNAMGYSPFSIESVGDPSQSQFRKAYDVLGQLTPLILKHQGTGTMAGFLLDSAAQTATMTLGNYTFTVRHEATWPYAPRVAAETPRCGGMIIQTAPSEFYVAGSGVVLTFSTPSHDGSVAGIEAIEEGVFAGGRWVAGRRLNGDEDHQGRHAYLPGDEYSIQKLRLYVYR